MTSPGADGIDSRKQTEEIRRRVVGALVDEEGRAAGKLHRETRADRVRHGVVVELRVLAQRGCRREPGLHLSSLPRVLGRSRVCVVVPVEGSRRGIDASRQRRQHVVVVPGGDGESQIQPMVNVRIRLAVVAEDALVGHGGSALRKYSGGCA